MACIWLPMSADWVAAGRECPDRLGLITQDQHKQYQHHQEQRHRSSHPRMVEVMMDLAENDSEDEHEQRPEAEDRRDAAQVPQDRQVALTYVAGRGRDGHSERPDGEDGEANVQPQDELIAKRHATDPKAGTSAGQLPAVLPARLE